MKALSVLGLFFALCGCGSSTSNDQACSDLAAARCAKRMSCGSTSIQRVYGDLNTCLAREKLICVNSLAAKSTGNSAANAENCAAAYAGQSCADFFVGNPPAVCVYTGTLASGTSCAFAGQCSTTYCVNEKVTQCGTCGAAPSGACDATTCARGQECFNDTVAMTMSCITPGSMGSPCNRTNPCQAGLSCVGATMMAMGSCQTAATMMGAACDPRQQMMPGCDANQGLYCNATSKTCQALAYVGDGAPCGQLADGTDAACTAGGECILATGSRMGTCKAPAADGAACDTSSGPPCLSPARCVTGGSGTAGTCMIADASKC
jgi:hypothetical protein